ncbi:WD domain G-beta repeat protein [Trichostrongylus colubriformis]|uniref:methylated diphthine methylhydrolase n=1 Tax=Trichostrongylus colubriformis TaxID=6319 RepID=A0AAN8F3S4_TRICO
MSCSIKLPQRPAFARSTPSKLLVSTYQLTSPDSRVGSLYILSHSLDIVHCITAPAGVFRFDFLAPNVIIAAVTSGSLWITSITDSPSNSAINVAEDLLLDVSAPSLSNHVCCTDKMGSAYIVDVAASTVIANWRAHSLPYTDTGCEVWTCAQHENLVCTGGEDATLKVWDTRSQSAVQTFKQFEAGVTFSEWQEDNLLLTGSYDQHIRLFDMRNNREALKTAEMNGGVWHIENCERAGMRCYLASCMYGGWALTDENFDVIRSDKNAGEQLTYGVTVLNENSLAYTTFNDFKVSTADL